MAEEAQSRDGAPMSDDAKGTIFIVLLVGSVLSLLAWCAHDANRGAAAWRDYRRAHRCIETGDVGGQTIWECDGKVLVR